MISSLVSGPYVVQILSKRLKTVSKFLSVVKFHFIYLPVVYEQQELVLPLIVVDGDGPPLLGRNWC